jgi:hypothetical protein
MAASCTYCADLTNASLARAKAPDHLGHNDHCEGWKQRDQRKTDANQGMANDHGPLTAEAVRYHPGRDLEDEHGQFQCRAHQHHLQRIKPRHLDHENQVHRHHDRPAQGVINPGADVEALHGRHRQSLSP